MTWRQKDFVIADLWSRTPPALGQLRERVPLGDDDGTIGASFAEGADV